jgi:hypothetical protein
MERERIGVVGELRGVDGETDHYQLQPFPARAINPRIQRGR